jgi:aspartyl-tRNA synthetase
MIKAFELVRLGEDDVKAKFPAMYNAFCYGAPPHAGIAPGVDRMVMLLAARTPSGDHPLPHEHERPGSDDGRASKSAKSSSTSLHIALVRPEEI